MDSRLRHRIIEAIRVEGAGSAWGIARSLGIHRQEVLETLDELLITDQVRGIDVNGRSKYFLSTKDFRDCRCDGTCLQQIVVLSSHCAWDTCRVIVDKALVSMAELLEVASASLSGDGQVLRQCIGRFLEVGLIREADGLNVGSEAMYLARSPHWVVRSVFGFPSDPT